MIDPALASMMGSGTGIVLRTAIDYIRHRADVALETKKAEYEHAESLNEGAREYKKLLMSQENLDKGEPYEYSLFWGGFTFKGTRADRFVAPPYRSLVGMCLATICGAVIICFLAADIVILERPASDDPDVLEILFGIIKHSSAAARVYIQSLGGLGASLAGTLSLICTFNLTGVYKK